MVACERGLNRSEMLIRSGTVSVSRIVPGYPPIIADNCVSFVFFVMQFPDLKVCDFGFITLANANCLFEIQFGYEIFVVNRRL